MGNEDLNDVSIQAKAPRTVLLRLRVDGDDEADISKLRVGLARSDRQEIQIAETPVDGVRKVEGVSTGGLYWLTIWPQESLDVFVKRVSGTGVSSPDGGIDGGLVGEEPLEVVLSKRGGVIRGSVTNAGGSEEITVVLAPDTEDAESREHNALETKANWPGAFTIRNIRPGRYRLFAWNRLPEGAWKDGGFWGEMKSFGQAVTVAEDDRLQIQLPLIGEGRTKAVLDRLGIR